MSPANLLKGLFNISCSVLQEIMRRNKSNDSNAEMVRCRALRSCPSAACCLFIVRFNPPMLTAANWSIMTSRIQPG